MMMDSSSTSTSLRRMLRVLLIASLLSVIFGILMSSVVFRIGDLERKQPFSTLYAGKKRGIWKPVSRYMLCTSIQWLMEVQGRTVEHRVLDSLLGKSGSEEKKAKELNEQAKQLEEAGQTGEAQSLRVQADQAQQRARDYELQALRFTGSKKRHYITRYYKLIVIPMIALCMAIWFVAAYHVPREVRRTNEIVKIGALVGLFHGMILGLLVILWSVLGIVGSKLSVDAGSVPVLWWLLGGQSLEEFYTDGKFYHGQMTGLWFYPVAGMILTGYLFGTLAGWLVKGLERLRHALSEELVGQLSKPA